jgi:two-component system copper resistance phosphate regulon response regulator CusR
MRSTHILLIEDHSPLAPYIHRTLEEDGFHVVSTPAHAAARFLTTEEWKLIILDRVFPSPDAADIIRLIKKESGKAKILVLSEHSAKQTEEEMRKFDLEHVLLKPFPFQHLIQEVRNSFTKETAHTGELFIDTLSLHPKNQTAFRDGKEITLTKKEFLLLLFLIRNKDKAVLEHVWGMQIDPLSNTIEAHILSLRKKVDSEGQNKLIHTVPKYGYKLSTQR